MCGDCPSGKSRERDQNNAGSKRLSVRMNQRLASQCLPDQQQDETEVSESNGAYERQSVDYLEVHEPVLAARDEPPEERQELHRVYAQEMGNPQIPASRAPTDDRQSRTAVGNSDAVRADDAWAVVCGHSHQLFVRRPNH